MAVNVNVNAHLLAALERAGPNSTTWVPRLAKRDNSPKLLPAQLAAVGAIMRTKYHDDGPWGPRGVLGLIGCGHGKTLIAGLMTGLYPCRRPLILTPHSVREVTQNAVVAWSDHYPVSEYVRFATYEQLSMASGASKMLDDLAPDLIVCDEAHYLSDASSARWLRLARYLQKNPSTRFCAMSGTMIDRELTSWSHLAHAALRDWSPLPANQNQLRHYSNVLDQHGHPTSDDYGWLSPLAPTIGTQQGYREAFHQLLTRTPGMVFSASKSCNASLTFRITSGGPPPTEVDRARTDLATTWALPDGTELVDALETFRAERTLRYGFYSTWAPRPDDPEEAATYDRWFEARRAWSAVVRRELARGNGDSPGEIRRHAEEGRLPWCAEALSNWRDVALLEPERLTKWCAGGPEYVRELLASAAQYFGGLEGVVVWYDNAHVAEALGLPVYGPGSRPPRGASAAVSWHVHSKGWNAQESGYHKQIVLQPPPDHRTTEQLLSRMHRHGQTRDVETVYVLPTQEALDELRKIRQSSAHVATLGGETPRILTGVWL